MNATCERQWIFNFSTFTVFSHVACLTLQESQNGFAVYCAQKHSRLDAKLPSFSGRLQTTSTRGYSTHRQALYQNWACIETVPMAFNTLYH